MLARFYPAVNVGSITKNRSVRPCFYVIFPIVLLPTTYHLPPTTYLSIHKRQNRHHSRPLDRFGQLALVFGAEMRAANGHNLGIRRSELAQERAVLVVKVGNALFAKMTFFFFGAQCFFLLIVVWSHILGLLDNTRMARKEPIEHAAFGRMINVRSTNF